MTIVVTAPEDWRIAGYRVFLAGAIDSGSAVDWQAEVVAALAGRAGLVLLNPRRADYASVRLDEQIGWELDALEAADRILMWFPAGSVAPVSMLETGLYLRSGKLLLGADPGFARRRNLELTAARFGLAVHTSLPALINSLEPE
ncbi:nucleoside 2-deoxyribosyltransferase domain-containing protein [Dactylosporangium sp. AC04546]|uniref:nucleoside 2-deoxyribosyltransferase domain-containing protein n=1 Tax=Dactylosporangium sp. AC04546 TaxID=2862460 RepID=UPI001EDD4AAF|nr:nucleoside 2-deoxyribosyltransferase domain-containing protein [Dactylosporangium sp. AC04546]WVK80243.1 nucleoside 2-deoxyribosyltransferase domain-containing protein [Dactylosporangium sp. AC04546]